MRHLLVTTTFCLLLLPMSMEAADIVAAPKDFKGFLNLLNGIIALLVPIIFALVFLTISWGIIKAWIIDEPGSDSVESGKRVVTVGVIALAIMFSLWGIVKLIQASLF
jgi:multisubunit Na+/H+ antiporter MnhB subunit